MLRLTKLDEQPSHGASRYVYDWLVALYTRANENVGYQHPQDVSEVDKKRLMPCFPPEAAFTPSSEEREH